jgi:DNA-binding beta-propeller fold protein YncE
MKTMIAVAAVLCVGWSVSWGETKAGSSADYELMADYKLGAPNFWDYLTYDPDAHRLYASHINKIEVIDTNIGKTVGQVGPLHDAHGVAIVTEAGKGYADSGDDGIVKVFSLSDLHVIKTVKVSKDADGMVYDPGSKTVLVVAGDSKNLTMIDVSNDQVVKTVPLPGQPEFFAIDGHGHAFINIADSGSLSKVDLSEGAVTATWKLEGCEDPHGIAYDPLTKRLFTACANRRMIVVDAESGKNLASLPIGARSDSVAVDSTRHRAFSANGDGTLTVISEGDNDTYTVQRIVPTFFGGRNMAIDAKTGTLFIAHGNMKLLSSTRDVSQLRFGWDGLDVAIMRPND